LQIILNSSLCLWIVLWLIVDRKFLLF
jgi:hypothetical protein